MAVIAYLYQLDQTLAQGHVYMPHHGLILLVRLKINQ
jgi:hypothetical protein